MSLFDQLVDAATADQPQLGTLRTVVEKELLHQDILREMSAAGLLSGLTFIGGTCLRMCYGANRLSEDLDFTGGAAFARETLGSLGATLEKRLQDKYGLKVSVSEPSRESGNVETWKVRITTRPERPDLPTQRINLDICAVPSYDAKPMMLRNHYGVDMGTSGLIIQAQSREEIFADKMIALALRPNRLKNRDLWDIGWLVRQGVSLPLKLLPRKLQDRNCGQSDFLDLLNARDEALQGDPGLYDHFQKEMQRFLPVEVIRDTVNNPAFWQYLTGQIHDQVESIKRYFDL